MPSKWPFGTKTQKWLKISNYFIWPDTSYIYVLIDFKRQMVIKSYLNGFNCFCHGVTFSFNFAGMTLSVYGPFNPLDENVRNKQHTQKT